MLGTLLACMHGPQHERATHLKDPLPPSLPPCTHLVDVARPVAHIPVLKPGCAGTGRRLRHLLEHAVRALDHLVARVELEQLIGRWRLKTRIKPKPRDVN